MACSQIPGALCGIAINEIEGFLIEEKTEEGTNFAPSFLMVRNRKLFGKQLLCQFAKYLGRFV
jgi:hypothetical protein